MPFRFLLPLLVAVAFFLYIGILNKGVVSFSWSPSGQVELSLIVLLLIAFFLGSISSAFFYQIGILQVWVERLFDGMDSKRKKRQQKLLDEAEERLLDGDNSRAMKKLEKVLSGEPANYHALILKGNILRDEGKLKEALDAHALAMAHNPASPTAVLQLKEDYIKAGQMDAAFRMLERAREYLPKDASILLEMALIAEKQGELRHAATIQKEALKFLKDDKGQASGKEKLSEFHFRHAMELLRSGDEGGADSTLRDALKVTPSYTPAVMELARLNMRMHSVDVAEKILKKEYRHSRDITLLPELERMYRLARREKDIVKLYRWAAELDAGRQEEVQLLPFIAVALLEQQDFIAAEGVLNQMRADYNDAPLFILLDGVIEAGLRERGDEAAMQSLMKSLRGLWRRHIKYCCGNCRKEDGDWFYHCNSCNSYGSAVTVTN